MELTEEWKKLFPIGRTFNPPLLVSSSSLGPLFFNPELKSPPKCLFSSPSLFPPLLSPPSDHSLAGFLSASSIPYSTSHSIGLLLGPNPLHDDIVHSFLSYNRLQLLHCPDHNIVLGFFSTGSNHHQVGFLVIQVKDDDLVATGDQTGGVYISEKQFTDKIQRILVNQVGDGEGYSGSSTFSIVGYLMTCSVYSVHWFRVEIDESRNRPLLCSVGFKLFKSSSIAGACWSPHLPEECVVLLESGALFLFDLKSQAESLKCGAHLKGNRLRVKWEEWGDTAYGKWLGCEFSWHPRILIVARSRAVFLVDLRADQSQCNLTCLAKIEMLSLYAPAEKEQFLSFSSTGFDAFQYVLVSKGFLVLCDVRQPLSPLLHWAHNLDRPCYIDVFRLSELRSQSRDGRYAWASEKGFCIILGSFWNSEFMLFCYGPSLTDSETSVISRTPTFCKPLYSWELPSDLSLSGRECHCGDCLLQKEFSNDNLPDWVVWQQKKEVVLGFGILDNDISKLFCESDDFGGFTLIRLLSSGKLEAQRYSASWNLVHKLDAFHAEPSIVSDSNFIYSIGDEEYKFPKRFKYLNLYYLNAYLNGNLMETLGSKIKVPYNGLKEKESYNPEVHEILCRKLKDCGFGRFRSSPVISLVFDDITLPTSICEVAKRQIWATLPVDILQLAFSNYSELLEVLMDQKKVPLEFLVVPDLQQLPPFFLRKPSCQSSTWLQKVQPSEFFVGPALPLPFLSTLHEFHNGCPDSQDDYPFSSESELAHICNEVMKVAGEVAISDPTCEVRNDQPASLADDDEAAWNDSQKSKSFYVYRPVVNESSALDPVKDFLYSDEKHARLICKLNKKFGTSDGMNATGLELFDDLCPIKLKFEADADCTKLGSDEVEAYNLLKRQFAMWQRDFNPYRELLGRINGALPP